MRDISVHSSNHLGRLLAVGGTILLLTGLHGCPDSGPTPPPAGATEVSIRNSAFSPRDVTIRVGETVRWTNEDPVFHTVTSGNPGDENAGSLFNSNDLIPYDSFSHQFSEAGEFVYFSKLDQGRPAMVGAKVIVTE